MADSNDGVRLSRILEPSDTWSSPSTPEERAANFRGDYGSISVTDRDACPPLRALAAFYGARGGHGPLAPAFALFNEREVTEAGGELQNTESFPPWPPDYNEAHRDIVGDLAAVATHFSATLSTDAERRVFVEREQLLSEMCQLLQENDPHEKFVTGVTKRMRKIFREDRPLWERLAARCPQLREDAEVVKALAKESRRP